MLSCTNSLTLIPALPTSAISSASTLSWRTSLALGLLPSQTSRLMNAMDHKGAHDYAQEISRPTPVSSVPSGTVLVVLVMFASFMLVVMAVFWREGTQRAATSQCPSDRVTTTTNNTNTTTTNNTTTTTNKTTTTTTATTATPLTLADYDDEPDRGMLRNLLHLVHICIVLAVETLRGYWLRAGEEEEQEEEEEEEGEDEKKEKKKQKKTSPS
ncbi:hypothetical protein Tdes44962_MAKER09438 [Teratosphaeria destructans]|uniref:Uncharacterized protein n=1 Tax=Teratosphaeria destructans TaxID=418781 RepID=A0A9W7STU5_9PEZI|nr:hypothetical protein Tdes44962_MAKER09438 [Teratosphaeria destructans]